MNEISTFEKETGMFLYDISTGNLKKIQEEISKEIYERKEAEKKETKQHIINVLEEVSPLIGNEIAYNDFNSCLTFNDIKEFIIKNM